MTRTAWAGAHSMAQIYKVLIDAVPDLTEEQARRVLGRNPNTSNIVRRAIMKIAGGHFKEVVSWEEFYAFLGFPIDLSHLHVPIPQEGFTHLIVVHPGLSIEKMIRTAETLFLPVSRWNKKDLERDLDKITTSVRVADLAPYAVWVRGASAADAIPSKSFNDCKKEGIRGITLLEYLLYFFWYFKQRGEHLDDQGGATLCTGTSCNDDGAVRVNCDEDQLFIRWCSPNEAYPFLRVREVSE